MATVPEIPCAANIDFDGAQTMLRANAHPLGMESVRLSKAGRRTLAEPVVARIDSPRRDSAAMDGYAVRSGDLSGNATRLTLQGESFAGSAIPLPLLSGTAVAVSTGAPMPMGADRVVMREFVRVEGSEVVVPSAPGKTHVRVRGSDFTCGQVLLQPGTRIDARTMLVAAAADQERVTVWRRPRIHVLCNGDELARPGDAYLRDDAVPDSLSEALLLMARQWGSKPCGISCVPDNADALRLASEKALPEADVLVIAGGASQGRRDHARTALLPLGLDLLFAGVAMKPAKPLWYGRIGTVHVLGLPGNPTAALTAARLFLAPLVSALAGAGYDRALRWSSLRSLESAAPGGDRDQFLCGHWDEAEAGARIIARQEASAQMMLATADLLVERRAGAPLAPQGAMLRCLPF
ncbi:molybdopterin molybdotransferase MoeA [Novosphingobium sp. 9]|uniref:molybdopterin molybdotransferase MoeA n=1 Tax=Novosphingobium sp. 9 TaxID=2025349 RepID=UPI0021B6C546|nr:molybdopterin molybdotransferase MoeA [Novosphingobium sp. 9]